MTWRTPAWTALLLLLAGVLALGPWWTREGPAAPALDLGDSRGRQDPDPVLRVTTHAKGGARERSAPREVPRPSAGVCAHIEVRARREDGYTTFDSVRAYALRAGSPGAAGTYEVPSVILKLDGEPARISLLHPGHYDVGVVTDWGYAMQRDVEVRAGAVVPVELMLAEPGVVQVRLHDPWPIPTMRLVKGWLVLDPGDARPGRPAPGRDEAYHPMCASGLWTELQGVCLPKGVPYRAHARLVEPAVMYATSVLRLQPGTANLLMEPVHVEAGDQVQLGFPELRRLSVRLRFPAEWPADGLSTLKLEARGEKWLSTYAWYRELGAAGFRKSDEADIRLLVPEGVAWELRWSGTRLASGFRAFTKESLAANDEIDVPLVLRTELDGEPLRIHVDLSRPAKRAYVSAFRSDPDAKCRVRTFPGSGVLTAPRIWRGEEYVVAHASDGRISRTVPMPRSGALELTWIQGGFVRVKGADRFPDEAAALVCTRADGGRFFQGGGLTHESYIEEDDRLGPFLPGSVELEIRAGRILLRRMKIEIRPGHESVLQLP